MVFTDCDVKSSKVLQSVDEENIFKVSPLRLDTSVKLETLIRTLKIKSKYTHDVVQTIRTLIFRFQFVDQLIELHMD